MSDAPERIWPDSLMIRDTAIHDDAGGLGQRIYTTAGAGYEKKEYIRADLVRVTGFEDAPQWLPIETAPKDGTVVDLWCKRSWNPPALYERVVDQYYHKYHKLWQTERETHYIQSTFDTRENRHLIPVGWMHRPKPPT